MPGPNMRHGAVAGGCPDGSVSVAHVCPPPSGRQGNFPCNMLRGFHASQVDIAFQRQFRLTERMQLRFRGESFNIFNHPNFGPQNRRSDEFPTRYSTQTLGNSLGSGGEKLYQIGGPRSIQLALKLQF